MKRPEVGTTKSRLEVGLKKLLDTQVQVAALQVQLTEMEPVLTKTQGEVDEMIVQRTKDKAAAVNTKAADTTKQLL